MGSLKFLLITIILPVLISASPFPNYLSKLPQKADEKEWWQSCSLYQIYPRSFKDSDGDGIGDIRGITQSLPYLKEIGVTATWLSPVFKSPMVDFGYDISDFYGIQPEYGTMDDFREMMSVANRLGIKVILDFVPNHSSDECEWFIKSAAKDPEYIDYYIWHPGFPDPNNATNRLLPNNWVSVFRGKAWTWHPGRKEFYMHQFASRQPDFNFRNPKVVEEMKNILRFWFDNGADGFRVDAIQHLFEIDKDANGNYLDEPWGGWTNDTDDYGYLNHIYTRDMPETVDMVYQWRQVTDEWQEQNGGDTKILLTEAYSPIEVIMQYYGNSTHNGAHLPFNFNFINDLWIGSNAYDYLRSIKFWMDNMPQGRTANWVLGNHDKRRAGSRLGEEKIDLLNMMMMILPGATVTYQGEEIGMTEVYIPWEETVDPQACNTNPDIYLWFSRDGCRTPFQWDDSTSAGFSKSPKTWLPVSPLYKEVNVKRQKQFVRSHLKTYLAAKKLRETKTFEDGELHSFAPSGEILVIARTLSGEPSYVYVANMGHKYERIDLTKVMSLPDVMSVSVSSTVSSRRIGEHIKTKEIILVPGEALILKTNAASSSILRYYFHLLN